MIRYIEEKDIQALNDLHHQIFKQPFDFSSYTNSTGFNYGLVMELENQIVGYLVSQIIFEISDLFYVTIHSDFKRQGLGYQLMSKYITDCKERCVDNLSLEVRVSNGAAINMYQKLGYHDIGKRQNYYSNGEDALLMLKCL